MNTYVGNTVKIYGHPTKDTPLLRTAHFVTKPVISVKMNLSNKNTPVLWTVIMGNPLC